MLAKQLLVLRSCYHTLSDQIILLVPRYKVLFFCYRKYSYVSILTILVLLVYLGNVKFWLLNLEPMLFHSKIDSLVWGTTKVVGISIILLQTGRLVVIDDSVVFFTWFLVQLVTISCEIFVIFECEHCLLFIHFELYYLWSVKIIKLLILCFRPPFIYAVISF